MLVPGEMFRWKVSWMGWDYQSNCFVFMSLFLSFFDYSTRLSALYSSPSTFCSFLCYLIFSLYSLLSTFHSLLSIFFPFLSPSLYPLPYFTPCLPHFLSPYYEQNDSDNQCPHSLQPQGVQCAIRDVTSLQSNLLTQPI